MPIGQQLLSQGPSASWATLLVGALLFHASHLAHHGEARWFHATHVAMLVGMIYMFVAAGWDLHWVPPLAGTALYAATSLGVLLRILIGAFRKRIRLRLWLLALMQQGGMVYMWLPKSLWLAAISYSLTAYFSIESTGWLVGALFARAPAEAERSLRPKTALGYLSFAAMAASMAYMIAAMQLKD